VADGPERDLRRPAYLLLVVVLSLALSAAAFLATEANTFRVSSEHGGVIGGGVGGAGASDKSSLSFAPQLQSPYLPLAGVLILSIIALVLFTRITRDQVLDHQRRRVIFEHVVARPGTHFRQMRDDLGIATGVLMHHLRTLEREGFIQSFAMNGKRLFFPAGVRPSSKPMREVILEEVRREPGITQAEIARRLRISRMLAHYYVRSLVLDGRLSSAGANHRGGLYPGPGPSRAAEAV